MLARVRLPTASPLGYNATFVFQYHLRYTKQKGEIKNDRSRWRIEHSCYNLDIVCHPGAENIAPDTFPRSFYAAVLQSQLSLI